MRLLKQTGAGPAVILNERAMAERAWSPEPDDWSFDYIADGHSAAFDLWIGELPPRDRCANAGEHSSAPANGS
jgi:hypothetical protein